MQLFQTSDIIPSVDLPTLLDSLQQQLGLFSPFQSADEMIELATLYPYHRPFLNPERHDSVHEILLNGGGKGLKTLMGRVANRFGANPPLRTCAICAAEDLANGTQPYWRRAHQLPGVVSCVLHGVDLTVCLWPSISPDRQEFVLAPLPSTLDTPTISTPMQVWFAAISRELLEAKWQPIDPQSQHSAFEQAIAAQGYVSRRGRIDHPALASAVRRHYQDFEGFFHRDRLLAPEGHPLGWLRNILERPLRASHPICHLLLIGFLFKTLAGFREALQHAEPQQRETAHAQALASNCSCQNPAFQQEDWLRDTALSCRTVAQLLHLSVTTVVKHRRALGIPISERRKHLTEPTLRGIETGLAKGLPPRLIASCNDVSLATVYRVRAERPTLLNTHVSLRFRRERQKQRKRWREAVMSRKNSGARQIRSKAAAAYAWLYRNDREWLRESCRALHSPREPNCTVDWNARDAEWCRRVETLAAGIRLQADRPRISKTLLLRSVGEKTASRNLARLPKLAHALASLVESQEDFQRFRIERAAKTLANQGTALSHWRIQRLAGIRTLTKRLKSHIGFVISNLQAKSQHVRPAHRGSQGALHPGRSFARGAG